MRGKTWLTFLAGAALAISIFGTIASSGSNAQAMGKGQLRSGPMAKTLGRLLLLRSQLNVTPEQQVKIRAVMQRHSEELVPVAEKIVEKNRALRAAVFAEPPDEEAIRAAADGLGRAIGDAAVLAAGIRAETRDVMTPDQIEKLEAFRVYKDRAVDSLLERLPSLLAHD